MRRGATRASPAIIQGWPAVFPSATTGPRVTLTLRANTPVPNLRRPRFRNAGEGHQPDPHGQALNKGDVNFSS